MNFLGDLSKSITTFTACWWFNLQYFSSSSNYIWQYCYNKTPDERPTCTSFGNNQFKIFKHLIFLFIGLKQNLRSMSQDVEMLLSAGEG